MTPAAAQSSSPQISRSPAGAPPSAPPVSRRAAAKLSFSPEDDERILAALARYPASRHSAMLAGWLRAGWRSATARGLSRVGQSALQPPPADQRPLRPLIRRVFVDSATDPGLAEFLAGLPRRERGREIRFLIGRALMAAAVPAATPAARAPAGALANAFGARSLTGVRAP